MIARPRTYVAYRFGFNSSAVCYVHCYPQQRWEAKQAGTDGRYVALSRKGVSITIPREDFEEHWKEVG